MPLFLKNTFLLLFCTVLLSQFAVAQDVLSVHGKMKLEQGRLEGKMEVTENGKRVRISNMTGNGKFEMDLKLNKKYVFSFLQEGYVTKKIEINTKIGAPRPDEALPFTPFEFHVTLFKQYEGINFVIFNQAVGRIQYDANLDDFDYDTDYTKSIREQIEIAEKQVEEKKKEEARLLKEEEKAEREAEQLAFKKAEEEEKALLAAEEAAKKEEARLAKEAEAKKNEERKLADAQAEAERKEKEKLAKQEADAKRKEEQRLADEKEAARKEDDRLAKIEEEKIEKVKPVKKEKPKVEKKAVPAASSTTKVKKEDPPAPRIKYRPKPPPTTKKPSERVVVLHSYTIGEMGYPNLNSYGYINFGDGTGRREITKEQFDEYAKVYH